MCIEGCQQRRSRSLYFLCKAFSKADEFICFIVIVSEAKSKENAPRIGQQDCRIPSLGPCMTLRLPTQACKPLLPLTRALYSYQVKSLTESNKDLRILDDNYNAEI